MRPGIFTFYHYLINGLKSGEAIASLASASSTLVSQARPSHSQHQHAKTTSTPCIGNLKQPYIFSITRALALSNVRVAVGTIRKEEGIVGAKRLYSGAVGDFSIN